MHTDRDSQLERIIAGIKSGSIGAAEPRARSARRRGTIYSGAKEILAPVLDSDAVARYEAAHGAHLETLRADGARKHQQAVATSDEHQAALTAAAAARGKDIASLPLDKFEFIQPFLIQGPLDEAIISPNNNTAKLHFHTDADGYQYHNATFWFIWNNNQNVSVAVNLYGTIQANGFVHAGADGGIFGGGRCDVLLDVFLGLVQGSLPPETQGYQTSQVQVLAHVVADSTGWLSLGDLEPSRIYGSVEALVQGVVVPAQRDAIFFVSFRSLSTLNGDAVADVDFTSGDFQITCPGVLVQTVS